MVKVKADVIEYDRAHKVATARGNVDVKYQGAHITSEFLQFDQGHDTVKTDQNFVLTQQDPKGTQTIKGSSLAYNIKSKEATVSDALLNVPAPDTGRPVFVSGKELRSDQKQNKFNVSEGIFSTCEDIEDELAPHYHVTSRSLELVQDDYALGWDSWIYVNNRRLFWVPFFWVPLKKRETSVQFGQNDVEGFFVKTSWGYRLTPQHYGTLYTNYMQKKGPGLGVAHNWSNVPNSLSLFETYGLAQSDQNPGDLTGLLDDPARIDDDFDTVRNSRLAGDPLAKHALDRNNRRPFDDYWWKIRHSQRLLDTMTVDLSSEDWNIYTVDNARNQIGQNMKTNSEVALRTKDMRDDFQANTVAINDDRFGVKYRLSRDFREDRNNKGSQNQRVTKYDTNASWAREGTSVNVTGGFSSTIRDSYVSPLQQTAATPSAGASPVPSPSPTPLQESLNTTAGLTVDQKLPPLPGTTDSSHLNWSNTYSKQVNPSPQPVRESLDEKLTYTSNLGWGDFRAEVSKKFLFEPPAGRDAYAQSGHTDKLPELEVKSKAIAQELQPFTLAADMGRYFDAAAYPKEDPAVTPIKEFQKANLGFINRFHPHVDLVSKPHDVGFLSTLDFGGTGFEQRFYSTGDQAYSTTLRSGLKTQYTEWLAQSLTYNRVLPGAIDEKDEKKRSNTPFQWDRLSLSKVTSLDGEERFDWKGKHARPIGEALALTGLPSQDWFDFPGAVTWTHNLGYDYERLRYSDYRTALSFSPNGRLTASINSSYHFRGVPYLDFKGDDPDPVVRGRWNSTTFSTTLRTTEEAFGGNWGLAKIVPGTEFNTALTWDPDKGKLSSLTNRLRASFGESWEGHWELALGGAFELLPAAQQDPADKDKDKRVYRITSIAIARDLHDFIVSFNYDRAPGEDRAQDRYLLKVRMTALNFDILSIDPNAIGAGNLGIDTTKVTGGQ